MQQESKELSISVRSFLMAIIVIFALMVASYILTFLIPGGTYIRAPDADGNLVVDTAAGFSYTQSGIPFWKWLLSPILVLGAEGSGTLIAEIVFLLVIGGVFSCLDSCGLMRYMLNKTANRFCAVRYRLMAVVFLFFMAMGVMIGSFEECVPMVPIVVALAVELGWDPLTGIGMSLLAVGCNMGVKSLNRYLNQYKAADETSKDITKRLINLEEKLTVDIRGFL